jgi:hypothetical protein
MCTGLIPPGYQAWQGATCRTLPSHRTYTHTLKPNKPVGPQLATSQQLLTQLTTKSACVVPPEDGRLTPETCRGLWKWKLVTLLWYIMIHSHQNIKFTRRYVFGFINFLLSFSSVQEHTRSNPINFPTRITVSREYFFPQSLLMRARNCEVLRRQFCASDKN